MNLNKFFILKRCILLIALGLLAYSGSFTGAFQLDDIPFIVENPGIRSLSDPFSKATHGIVEHSRHLVFFTFALNYHWHQLDVVGYHVFNFIVHLISTCLVWILVSLIFRTPKIQSVNLPILKRAEDIALASAMIFLVHPANTQAVIYICQRFESMAAMFYLATLCCYLKWRLKLLEKSENETIKTHGWLLLAFLMACAGTFCKEITITIPLMIGLFETVFFLNQNPEKWKMGLPKQVYWVLIPLIAVALIIPFLFSFKISSMLFLPLVSASHDGEVLHFHEYVLTQLRVIATFLRLLFIPVGQNFDYDFPKSINIVTPWTTLVCFVFLSFLTASAWRLRKIQPMFSWGILWFFVVLLPNFIPRSHVIFEHKIYLASVGVIVFFVITFAQGLKTSRKFWLVMSTIVVLLTIVTIERCKVWQTDFSMWSDVIHKSPNKYTANQNLGCAYFNKGDQEQALRYLNRAIELKPEGYKALANRASIYILQDRLQEALNDINRVLQTEPRYFVAYNVRGKIYEGMRRPDLALDEYTQAIKSGDHSAAVYLNRGALLSQLGQLDRGFQDFQTVIRFYPHEAKAYFNSGVTMMAKNELQKAQAFLDQAIKLNPKYTIAYFKRAEIFLRTHQLENAQQDFNMVRKLDPSFFQNKNLKK